MALSPSLALTKLVNPSATPPPSQTYIHSPGANPAGAAAYTGGAADYVAANPYAPAAGAPTPFPAAPTYQPAPAYQAPAAPAGVQGRSTSQAWGMLDSDPGVLATQALSQQGLSQLDSFLKAQRERAIINFGDPALASQAGFGLDPQAGTFAQQNYLAGNATLARLDKAHKDAKAAVINRLASHNILNSGDLGYQENEADTAYGNSKYDATQNVLDSLAQLYQNYLGQRTQLQQNIINARLAALQNYLQNPYATGTDQTDYQAPGPNTTPFDYTLLPSNGFGRPHTISGGF